MTHQNQSSELFEAVQLLSENGFEGMANAMQILIDEAMKLERNEYLRATPYQRTEEHRKRMRTTNMLERQNREIKRRTRVATLFPNEASLLRLVTAVLVELSDDWETGKTRYLVFQN